MSKNFSEFPQEVAACLWSYDVSKLDLYRDQREIITQVLNYGTWNAVKWLRQNYSNDEISEILTQPSRGRWFKQCLNFWLLQFNLNLPPDSYQKAIFRLDPAGRVR